MALLMCFSFHGMGCDGVPMLDWYFGRLGFGVAGGQPLDGDFCYPVW